MSVIYLSLGSNLGDSIQNLAKARERISEQIGRITLESSLYRTASWGNRSQPEFVNQVVCADTDLVPEMVLSEIGGIEAELGRVRSEKWGARTIDIDILFYDDQIISLPGLQVPHLFVHERRFCLQPMSEIAGSYIHPGLKKTVSQLLDELSDDLLVKKLS